MLMAQALSPQKLVDRLGAAKTSWASKRQQLINCLSQRANTVGDDMIESPTRDAAEPMKMVESIQDKLDQAHISEFLQ